MSGQPGPVTRCRSCKTPIRWANTITGKLIPLEATPDPDGNVTIDDQQRAHVDPTGQPSLLDDADVERWMPHWASCPHAAEWRKGQVA